MGERLTADRLRRVDEQRHLALGRQRGRGVDRLMRAHLVVRRLQGQQRYAGLAESGVDLGEVHPTQPVDAERPRVRAHERGGGVQDAGVLDRRRQDTPADALAPTDETGEPELHRLGARGRERHLVGAGAEHPGHRLAGGVEQHPGPPRLVVAPRRVGPALVERGEQGRARGGVQGRGGGGVEVARGRVRPGSGRIVRDPGPVLDRCATTRP